MQVKITKKAQLDMQDAYDYLANDNKKVAKAVLRQIKKAIEIIIDFPQIGRTGRVKGTRELVLGSSPYILVYRIKDDILEILVVLHTSRNTKY